MLRSRLAFWKSTLRGWWIMTGILMFVWGLVGNIRSEFISQAAQDSWRLPTLFPQVSWYWLVIAFLVLTLVAVLEGAYRQWNKEHKAHLAEKAKNEVPVIVGSIDEVYIQDASAGLQQELSAIVLHVSLTNTASRPVTIKHYELEVVIDGQIHAAKFQRCRPVFMLEEVRLANDGLEKGEHRVPREDLPTRPGELVTQGVTLKGWLCFTAGRAPHKVEKAKLVLTVIDAFNGRHFIEVHPPFVQHMKLVGF
jgi:hypothetical protein